MSTKKKNKSAGVVDAATPRRKPVHRKTRRKATPPKPAPTGQIQGIVDDANVPPVRFEGTTAPEPMSSSVSMVRRIADEGKRLYEKAKERVSRIRNRKAGKADEAPRGRAS